MDRSNIVFAKHSAYKRLCFKSKIFSFLRFFNKCKKRKKAIKRKHKRKEKNRKERKRKEIKRKGKEIKSKKAEEKERKEGRKKLKKTKGKKRENKKRKKIKKAWSKKLMLTLIKFHKIPGGATANQIAKRVLNIQDSARSLFLKKQDINFSSCSISLFSWKHTLMHIFFYRCHVFTWSPFTSYLFGFA